MLVVDINLELETEPFKVIEKDYVMRKIGDDKYEIVKENDVK